MLFVTICTASRAGQKSGFVLSGNFEDNFAGKQDLSGSFTVEAFESNALIDVTYENGLREVVGTDGHDTFTYIPVTGDQTNITNANGLATISYGRFPTEAQEFEQLLWLVCVDDHELITNVSAYRFPFYARYNTNDMLLQVTTNSDPPFLITSIKWFGPNYIPDGTNHYELALYPHGWLKAVLDVTKTKHFDQASVPSEILFTQYRQRPLGSNDLQSDALGRVPKTSIRTPSDVVAVEVALFSITNSEVSAPLSSYIPKILDKTAVIHDKRIGDQLIRVASGEWWNVKEKYQRHVKSVTSHRTVILIFLSVTLILPVFLLIRTWRVGKKNSK
jgi:hypothetical protein